MCQIVAQVCINWLFLSLLEHVLAQGLGESLYGVAQHGARHGGGSRRDSIRHGGGTRISSIGRGDGFVEPCDKPRLVTLASFAQQPSHSFLQQVVQRTGFGEEYLGNVVGVVEFATANELHSAYYAYALLPQRGAVCRKVIE